MHIFRILFQDNESTQSCEENSDSNGILEWKEIIRGEKKKWKVIKYDNINDNIILK